MLGGDALPQGKFVAQPARELSRQCRFRRRAVRFQYDSEFRRRRDLADFLVEALDLIFADRAVYERVKRARVLTPETVCRLYGIEPTRLADFVEFDPGNAIKFTLYRRRPSGSPGDPDIFGAQQYAPLLDIEVPDD